MAGAAWQSQKAAVADRSSLLYSLLAGEEIVEGPLNPSAYANASSPGVGGARLAILDASAGVGLITFDDPEVSFASTLGGNAVTAPLMPIPLESTTGEETGAVSPRRQPATIYTIQPGDTVAGIAAQFNISPDTILSANGLTGGDTIKVGDNLKILPVSGIEHEVSRGDTLLAIANKYDVSAAEIATFNNLTDTSKLSIGQALIIPGGHLETPQAPRIVSSETEIASKEAPPPSADAHGSGFLWPTTTRHISQYFRWGHTGVDIDNQSRPPVYAASAGTVEYAGWLGGYGNLLVVNHGNGLQTYYAHLDKFYVAKGEAVNKGEAIAKMGSTGRSTGPHVHFEIRRNGQPVNPLGFF